MPPMIISIASTGRGILMLKKAIEIGADFIVALPKNPEKLQEALDHVNVVFEKAGLNLRLHVKEDFSVEAVILKAGAGAAIGAVIGIALGFGWLAPAILGAGIGAASEVIEVRFVKPVPVRGGPGVAVSI